MHLFSQYNDHERDYKPGNDMFFAHFEFGYLTSCNILIAYIRSTHTLHKANIEL